VRPRNGAVQQDGRTGGSITDRPDFGDLVPDWRGAVDLNRSGRTGDQNLVGIPQCRPGNTGVVLQLWRVNDHHVIGLGDLGHATVQFARWQSHDPEWEGRLRLR
jgi:hypothetical protein